MKSHTSAAAIKAQQMLEDNSKYFKLQLLSEDSRYKIEGTISKGNLCSKCRWNSGCLECHPGKALRYYWSKEAHAQSLVPGPDLPKSWECLSGDRGMKTNTSKTPATTNTNNTNVNGNLHPSACKTTKSQWKSQIPKGNLHPKTFKTQNLNGNLQFPKEICIQRPSKTNKNQWKSPFPKGNLHPKPFKNHKNQWKSPSPKGNLHPKTFKSHKISILISNY